MAQGIPVGVLKAGSNFSASWTAFTLNTYRGGERDREKVREEGERKTRRGRKGERGKGRCDYSSLPYTNTQQTAYLKTDCV